MLPNAEQAAVLRARRLCPGTTIRVTAAAGTGKSALLRMIAEQDSRPLLYLGYNSSIVTEAKAAFPRHVQCSTVHGVAYRVMRVHEIRDRLRRRLWPREVATLLGIPHRAAVPAAQMAGWVIEAVRAFCASADWEISAAHCGGNPAAAEDCVRYATELWSRLSAADTDLPLEHDFYLKWWHLRGGAIHPPVAGILVDEAQDSNPVTIDIFRWQPAPGVWVGDTFQSIYAYRGAIDAMETLKAPEYQLLQSYRFGESIAVVANAIRARSFAPPETRIRGLATVNSMVGPLPPGPYTILARTNAGLLAALLATDGPVSIVGGASVLVALLRGLVTLLDGGTVQDVPALSRFRSAEDLVAQAEGSTDPEMRLLTTLLDRFDRAGLTKLAASLEGRVVADERQAAVVLSTAHRSKGRQWRNVRLADDFPSIAENMDHFRRNRMSAEQVQQEINLLYVAVTRAQEVLEPNGAVLEVLYAERPPGR